ncbi:hypothetical protein M6D81_19160 [Paenibacillus sp. J5C_2022]|uniref:hypothetical protein n=1 Tax=Paenibacillus sp. J5C2022 TaxID=2977129 RepID=UPI0021D2312B|nr:hypothetical protein [Paenibacillus sp. J5C2022]MCU6710816.1 hypothetical protein [Paenibacillus sp. J5C2022]
MMRVIMILTLLLGDMFALTASAEKHSAEPIHTEWSEVNGISIYDSREAVVEKLGEPERISQDEHLPGVETYHYEAMSITFQGNQMQYVDMEASGVLTINRIEVGMTEREMRRQLGEPAYEAEDGIVFQRGDMLLKLFLDGDTGAPQYVSYYHVAIV